MSKFWLIPLVLMASCGPGTNSGDVWNGEVVGDVDTLDSGGDIALDSGGDIALDSGGDIAPDIAKDTHIPPEPNFDQSAAQMRLETFKPKAMGDGSPFINFNAALLDAPRPDNTEVTMEEGQCRFKEATNPFCDPPCAGDEVCVSPGTCVPYPVAQDAGVLTITGTGALSVTAKKSDFATYYYNSADEGFPAGQVVTVDASGGDIPAFDLSTTVVQPLILAGEMISTFDDSEDLTFSWDTPEPTTRIRLRLAADHASHGLTYPAMIECDAPDTGQITIPQALLSAILKPEYWGCGECPGIEVERYRRVTTMVGEVEVELRQLSNVRFYPFPDFN